MEGEQYMTFTKHNTTCSTYLPIASQFQTRAEVGKAYVPIDIQKYVVWFYISGKNVNTFKYIDTY